MTTRRLYAIAVGLGLLTLGLVAVPFALFDRGAGPPSVAAKNLGWAGPEAVAKARPVVAGMPKFSILGDRVVRAGKRNARLWDAVKAVNGGRHVENIPQEIGDCTGFSGAGAVTYLNAVAKYKGEVRSWGECYPPYSYGVGRVFVSRGSLDLSQDGCVVAYVVEGMTRYGTLAKHARGVPPYAGEISRDWGRNGPPEKFVAWAKRFKVETVAPIRSAGEAAAAIDNGYPVVFGASYGTETFVERDGRWVAVGDGSWNHAMFLAAYDEDTASGKRYFGCVNSWGPDGGALQIPRPLQGEPPGSFWIPFEDVEERIVSCEDCFAISNFPGFPSRDIDFSILASKEHGDERLEAGRRVGGDGGSGDLVRRGIGVRRVAADGRSGRSETRVLDLGWLGSDPRRLPRPGPDVDEIRSPRRDGRRPGVGGSGPRALATGLVAGDRAHVAIACSSTIDVRIAGFRGCHAGPRSAASVTAGLLDSRRLAMVVAGPSGGSAAPDPVSEAGRLSSLPHLRGTDDPGSDPEQLDGRAGSVGGLPGDRPGGPAERALLRDLLGGQGPDLHFDRGRSGSGPADRSADDGPRAGDGPAGLRPADRGSRAAGPDPALGPWSKRDGHGAVGPWQWSYPLARWLAREVIGGIVDFLDTFFAEALDEAIEAAAWRIVRSCGWLIAGGLVLLAVAGELVRAILARLVSLVFKRRR